MADTCLGKMLDHQKNRGVMRPYLRNINVRWGSFDLDDVREMPFEEDELDRYSVRVGDVVVCEGGEPGRCAVWTRPTPFFIQKALHRVRCGPAVAPKFVSYWLRHMALSGALAKRFTGSTIQHLPGVALDSLVISYPVVSEQHQIVHAIEKHFSHIDAAVASLARAKANLKRARASVLKAAVEGRLVPTEAALARAEGREYEQATELLARILAERKKAWAASGARGKYAEPVKPETEGLAGLPEGWCWASMDALLHGIEAGRSFAADNTVPSSHEVGIVKVSAVTWGNYDEDEAKTVHDAALINPDYFVRRGDLLISRANTIELVGTTVIAERVTRRTMLSDKILRLNMPVAFRRYALWVLRSGHGRQQIEALATGNQESMRNIGQDRIRQIAVPFAPLAEQHRIVAEVDRRLSVLDTLEASVDANLARCARLRQSVLKLAFEGRLVPAEADAPLLATESQMPLAYPHARR